MEEDDGMEIEEEEDVMVVEGGELATRAMLHRTVAVLDLTTMTHAVMRCCVCRCRLPRGPAA